MGLFNDSNWLSKAKSHLLVCKWLYEDWKYGSNGWNKAIDNRGIGECLLFHSSGGIQYASHKFRDILKFNKKLTQSMSWKVNYLDNAVAETFFKTIKYECINRYRSLFNCIRQYIDWYNTKRLHSSLGYLTPLEKEIKLREFHKIAA